MELTLTHQAGSQILVTCDNQPSHMFDLLPLIPHQMGLPQPLDDPVTYGQALYAALFPPEILAQRALANAPERIVLITTDNDLDAVPWEYAYGPYGSGDSESLLILECHFVRGLPADQRIAPPTLDIGLHVVAIPSNPLGHDVEPLNIDSEWMRLKEIIQHVPYAITLERTRPPTIEQVRTLVANQRHRVIHFMGHGGQDERGALLFFEQENGDLDPVTARQFVLRVRGTVFLVTLNACGSATPGATTFSNLAASLVRQKVPYALGMRFGIPDEDARAFSRIFYNDLARGSSVEEALLQARLTLATCSRPWVVGVPVLYTSLAQPATGFASLAGTPLIKEHQPRLEVSALPRAEGTFQGRIDELKVLGTALTSYMRPPIITIHGGGGQGKTALAREAVERFAYAWPGGIWTTSLENLPSRELFVSNLARFLNIDTQKVANPEEVELVNDLKSPQFLP
jgi:CHAT domain